MIKRALISVSDKTGIADFARELNKLGIEIISTGGTYKLLKKENLAVISIDQVTGFPEIMNGRVKTLHPKIHGGLLALRDNPLHQQEAKENNIEFIDLVVVNLYPFEQTVAQKGVDFAEAIENIDIGGPTMLRSAAKNHKYVIVITDPADYTLVIDELKKSMDVSLSIREKLCIKVFKKTSTYDTAIVQYLNENIGKE